MYIQQLGQLQVKKLCDLTTEERMIKFHVHAIHEACNTREASFHATELLNRRS